jgi:hypothetical protein
MVCRSSVTVAGRWHRRPVADASIAVGVRSIARYAKRLAQRGIGSHRGNREQSFEAADALRGAIPGPRRERR